MFSGGFNRVVRSLILTISNSTTRLAMSLDRIIFLLNRNVFINSRVLYELLRANASTFLMIRCSSNRKRIRVIITSNYRRLMLNLETIRESRQLVRSGPFIRGANSSLLILIISIRRNSTTISILLVLSRLTRVLRGSIMSFIYALSIYLNIRGGFRFSLNVRLSNSHRMFQVFLRRRTLNDLFRLFLFCLLYRN